jgi:hypothetical protein
MTHRDNGGDNGFSIYPAVSGFSCLEFRLVQQQLMRAATAVVPLSGWQQDLFDY